jgi:SH3-like domain-containing protein
MRAIAILLATALAIGTVPAAAQDQGSEEAMAQVDGAAPGRGAVTNLPVPRYVSLKTAEGNVRRGPSLAHRIDWVFTRRDMPLRVTAEYEHWRRVEDNEGQGGWIHYSLLSGVRTVLVEEDLAPLRRSPDSEAEALAKAQAGVIARLGGCVVDWCEVSAGGQDGWIAKSALWGVDPDEIRE